jgi:hypothetical protein
MESKSFRDIPIFFAALVCILLILDYFVQPGPERALGIPLTKWASIVTGFAMMVGMTGVIVFNIKNMVSKDTAASRRTTDLLLVVSLIVTFAFGVMTADQKNLWANNAFQWIFNYIFNNLYNTVWSFLALYILVAAYRHLKPKTLDSIAFIVPVILLAMKNTIVISATWPVIWSIGDWIMRILVTGPMSGLLIVVFIGSVSFVARTLIGRHRRLIGGE